MPCSGDVAQLATPYILEVAEEFHDFVARGCGLVADVNGIFPRVLLGLFVLWTCGNWFCFPLLRGGRVHVSTEVCSFLYGEDATRSRQD